MRLTEQDARTLHNACPELAEKLLDDLVRLKQLESVVEYLDGRAISPSLLCMTDHRDYVITRDGLKVKFTNSTKISSHNAWRISPMLDYRRVSQRVEDRHK